MGDSEYHRHAICLIVMYQDSLDFGSMPAGLLVLPRREPTRDGLNFTG
jgi:hypothetical protein